MIAGEASLRCTNGATDCMTFRRSVLGWTSSRRLPGKQRKQLNMQHCACAVQADRFMEDYQLGKTYIDPKHVSDGGVTPDHVRRWKVLQELQVNHRTQGIACQ